MKLIIKHKKPDGSVLQTIGRWKQQDNLADWIERYIAALLPGGKCAYVSETLGYAPIPFEAAVLDGPKLVDSWPRASLAEISSTAIFTR